MILSDEEFDEYLSPLNSDQATAIRAIRAAILQSSKGLEERIETGKWYTGLLVYEERGIILYALGPLTKGFTTFHMMPFYGSAALQEKHGAVLKPLLSGKSCIKFRRIDQVPLEAITDILGSGSAFLDLAEKMFEARKGK